MQVDKEDSQVDMIIALAQDNKLWAYQANEFILSLKSTISIEKVFPFIFASIVDKLLVHTLFDTIKKESIESKCILVLLFIDILSKPQILLEYTALNPNGHYVLDLSRPHER